MFEVCESANASAESVWAILADTRRWPEWGPSVTRVEHGPRMLHAQSRGRVRLPMGVWLPFQVTDFEVGRSFRWNVAGIPATGHRVLPLGRGRSRVVFEVPALAAPYALVCKFACRTIVRLAESENGE
ncbi:MAG: SRPBCC family protein [Polyangiales bacterium]